MGVTRPGHPWVSQFCGYVHDLQVLPMVAEELVLSAVPGVVRGDCVPIQAPFGGPGRPQLSDSRPRPGESCLTFDQLPSEAFRSRGSCKVTSDPATFCNWDQVPSGCLERRLWCTKDLPRPGLSTPQEVRGCRPPPLPSRNPIFLSHLQARVASLP